jgi:hypothetical protein
MAFLCKLCKHNTFLQGKLQSLQDPQACKLWLLHCAVLQASNHMWCCGCCTVCGVIGVALCGIACIAWCHGHHTTWCHRHHTVWCHQCHTTCGITIIVIVPCGVVVVVAVIMEHCVAVTVIAPCGATVTITVIMVVVVGGWAMVGPGGRG